MSRIQFAESKSKRYWKEGWNLGTILYFFISLVFAVALVFIVRYSFKGDKQKSWQTALSFSFITLITINLIVILVRKGLGKWFFKIFIDLHRSRIISSRAKEQYSPSMSQFEKDKIINRVRREYDIELNKKAKEKSYKTPNNLSFLLLIGIGILVIIVLIPFFALKIVF
ncbi:hypothetical protein AB5V95_02000 [Metamycoplasma spumans]|uniref:hypothetical protein n=1 Tax=Metamycoplasma spumans TaxID=92406 RepID=UPI0034DDA49B